MVNRSNELREHNRHLILNTLLTSKSVSRQMLIEKTGLAPSTVSSIMQEIIKEKMLKKTGQINSPGTGRKTDLFEKNAAYSHALVINLTMENDSIALVDFELHITDERQLNITDYSTASAGKIILEEIHRYLKANTRSIEYIVLALPHYPYVKEDLLALLEESVSLPVYTINNVEAMGIYDNHYLYPESEMNSLFYIFVGRGIGSAFFHRGDLLIGANGYASDLGHIHITDNNTRCRCGRVGCLEAVASEESIIQSLLKEGFLKKRETGKDLIAFLKGAIEDRNDALLNLTIKAAASYLAEAILTVNSLFDPQVIILTGRLVELNPYFSHMLEESLLAKAGKRSLFHNKLIFQKYYPQSAIKGAALYAFLSALSG